MEFFYSLSSCNLLLATLISFGFLPYVRMVGILGWVWVRDLLCCTSCMCGPALCTECYVLFLYTELFLLCCVQQVHVAKRGG